MNNLSTKSYDSIRTDCSKFTKDNHGGFIYEFRKQFQNRFWTCVDKRPYEEGSHWYWIGSRNNIGEPIFTFNGVTLRAKDLADVWNNCESNIASGEYDLHMYEACLTAECINPSYNINKDNIPENHGLGDYDKKRIKELYSTGLYTTRDLVKVLSKDRRIISNFIASTIITKVADD